MSASSLDSKIDSLEASFTNKFEVLNTTLAIRLDAQNKIHNTNYNTLIWLLGILTMMRLFDLFASLFNLGG